VAAKRRKLPLGGQLKEDCVFQWANDGKIGKLADYRRWKQLPHYLIAGRIKVLADLASSTKARRPSGNNDRVVQLNA